MTSFLLATSCFLLGYIFGGKKKPDTKESPPNAEKGRVQFLEPITDNEKWKQSKNLKEFIK